MKRRTCSSILVTMALLLTQAPVALAATTWYVNGSTGSDTNNCRSATVACRTIGHAISLAASGDSVRIAAGTYNEHVLIKSSLNLIGSGAATTIIDGHVESGTVFAVWPGITVTLENVTIRNGWNLYLGGGVRNLGTLEIVGSTIESNSVGGSGIGGASGGGIRNDPGATLTIRQSTIAGNRAYNQCVSRTSPCGAVGGGISNAGGLALINSTVYGNTAHGTRNGVANGAGGGIAGGGEISNSTISGNTANAYGGGIYAGTAVLQNSIVAGNGGGNCAGGYVISNGYNLSSDASCHLTGPGDRNNTDPGLGTFGYNGGQTQTIPLVSGSHAVDAGNPGGCADYQGHLLTTDQRGYPRPDKEDKIGCDVGAYELQQSSWTLTGLCWGSVYRGAPQQCGIAQDLTQCPEGQPVVTLTTVSGCLPPQTQAVDHSRLCRAQNSSGHMITGYCQARY